MRLGDVDLPARRVRLRGKGNRERMVPLGRHAAHWLRRYLADARPRLFASARSANGASENHTRTTGPPARAGHAQQPLWVGRAAGAQTGQSINLQVKTHARAAGIATPLTIHSLRRACATHMLAGGAHPAQIQRLLGHATLKHLGQYLRLSIRELQQTHRHSNPGQ